MARHDQRPSKKHMTCSNCINGDCSNCVDVTRILAGFNDEVCQCTRKNHSGEPLQKQILDPETGTWATQPRPTCGLASVWRRATVTTDPQPLTGDETHCGTCGVLDTFPDDIKSECAPYGPGGSWICVRCGLGTPEAVEQSKQAFLAISDAETAATGTHVIGGARRV